MELRPPSRQGPAFGRIVETTQGMPWDLEGTPSPAPQRLWTGARGSRKGSGSDAILGASPTLERPGAAPGAPGFEEDYERALPRAELLVGMVFGRGGGGTLDLRVASSPHSGLAPLESGLEASERSLWGEHLPHH